MLNYFSSIYPLNAYLLFFTENLFIVIGVVILGHFFQPKNKRASILKITKKEIGISLLSLLFNTLITIIGLVLYKSGYVHFKSGFNLYTLIDFFVLIFTMDLLMYALHFLIHKLPIYKAIHGLHHQYSNPKPIDLFVLSPLEVISFGMLWLVLIFIYGPNFHSSLLYLITNVLFGMIGHLSHEPFPKWWIKTPLINLISTSTFHWQHHQNIGVNFGFYTLIWDKLFGTLSKDYESDFNKLREAE